MKNDRGNFPKYETRYKGSEDQPAYTSPQYPGSKASNQQSEISMAKESLTLLKQKMMLGTQRLPTATKNCIEVGKKAEDEYYRGRVSASASRSTRDSHQEPPSKAFGKTMTTSTRDVSGRKLPKPAMIDEHFDDYLPSSASHKSRPSSKIIPDSQKSKQTTFPQSAVKPSHLALGNSTPASNFERKSERNVVKKPPAQKEKPSVKRFDEFDINKYIDPILNPAKTQPQKKPTESFRQEEPVRKTTPVEPYRSNIEPKRSVKASPVQASPRTKFVEEVKPKKAIPSTTSLKDVSPKQNPNYDPKAVRKDTPLRSSMPQKPPSKAPFQDTRPQSGYYDKPLSKAMFEEVSEEFDQYEDEINQPGMNERLIECNVGCGRSFTATALKKHAKICAKVFLNKRKKFDTTKVRIEGIRDENAMPGYKPKAPPKSAPQPKVEAKKLPKWKLESLQLRTQLRGARNFDNPSQVSQKDREMEGLLAMQQDTRKRCPHCGRGFEEKVLERHQPFCQSKAKANSMKDQKQKPARGGR